MIVTLLPVEDAKFVFPGRDLLPRQRIKAGLPAGLRNAGGPLSKSTPMRMQFRYPASRCKCSSRPARAVSVHHCITINSALETFSSNEISSTLADLTLLKMTNKAVYSTMRVVEGLHGKTCLDHDTSLIRSVLSSVTATGLVLGALA